MDDPFVQLLRDWQSYYFLTGSASGGLIGLLYVAISLGTGIASSDPTVGTRAWATPIIVHFSAALLISALLIPTLFEDCV